MNLNEKMFTSNELKTFASKFEPKSKLTVKNIPAYSRLESGIQSRVDWALKKYNDYVEKYNSLRDNMLNGRV